MIACKTRNVNGKITYETAQVTINPPDPTIKPVIVPSPSTITNDQVYKQDGSPDIGTFKWHKDLVTYSLFLKDGEVINDIPNNHNVAVAVNTAFEYFHLFADPKIIRFQRVPYDVNNPADITIKIDANDPVFLQDKNVMAYCHYPETTPAGMFTCVINPAYLWSLDGKTFFSNNLRQTLRHELGHGIGMVHTIDPKDLMYPFYHNDVIPTNEDILQIQTMYGKRNIPNWMIKGFFQLDSELGEFKL